MRRPLSAAAALLLLACGASAPAPSSAPSAEPVATVPLRQASGQFHTLPVTVSGEQTTAILDTGIGLALVSGALCARVGCEIDGEFVGQRMSGQEVRVPLTRLASLEVGGVVQRDVTAAVIEIEGFFPEPHIEAFVGLPFFRDQPFTIDGPGSALVLESEASLAARAQEGRSLPIRLHQQGPALDTFVRLSLGDGQASAEVLMDTGSRTLILHPRYVELLGVDLEDARRREGEDETGNPYERAYVTLDGPVAFEGAPELRRTGAEVMFQEIIYDGLIGTALLSEFAVTWDLGRERILVAER